MDVIMTFAGTLVEQMQKPTLAFLIVGMMLAALGSKFEIPDPVYKFVVILLLLKVGMGAGISIRSANFAELIVPAIGAVAVGITIVFLGSTILSRLGGVNSMDSYATAGLFGAVSASTLAAGMAMLDDANMFYEGFIGALYPFMDIAALVTAIVLAKMAASRKAASATVNAGGTVTLGGGIVDGGTGSGPQGQAGENMGLFRSILTDTLKSAAISALLAGLALGLLARPDSVYESFYDPLFRGLLSILMIIMGMEAWARLSEMRKVAHVYLLYGVTAPFLHGALGFGAGMIAHELTGFSAGGVVLLSVMAASSSDISGPPTIRAALPKANSSAYIGTSTGLGTPIAILSIPLWITLAEMFV